jgi:hypothetical protein
MKKYFLIPALMAVVLMMATPSFGQEARIALKGNAVAVGSPGKAGLEVNGKLVVPKNYKSFQTDGDGTLFVVEANDGKFGVVDRKGTFIYKCTYYKAQITGDMIRLQTTASSEPKFYKVASPTVEVKVTKVNPWTFEPETQAAHRRTIKKAEKISEKYPFSAFEFRENEKGALELWIDGAFDLKEYKNFDDQPVAVPVTNGKKLFEAKNFHLISNYAYFEKTTAWIFEVEQMGMGKRLRGVFTLYVYKDKETGKKGVDTYMSIPFEYSSIGPCREHVAACSSRTGTTQYLNWATGAKANGTNCGGFKLDVDPQGTGKFTYSKQDKSFSVDMCKITRSANDGVYQVYFYRSAKNNWLSYEADLFFNVQTPKGVKKLESGTYKAVYGQFGVEGTMSGGKFDCASGGITIAVDGEIYTVTVDVTTTGGDKITGTYKGEAND